MDTAELLRTVRRRAGLSLRALAERAGTSGATLSAYEQGRVTPRTDTLVRIVTAAGVTLEPTLAATPARDPRRAAAGDELRELLRLADLLPTPTREDLPRRPHARFPSS